MGLFDKLKKIDTNIWGEAFEATPQVYGKPDGSMMGAIALTEGTLTVLPKNPKNKYLVDGSSIDEWNLGLISTTEDTMIGTIDYYEGLSALGSYIIDEKADLVLVKALTLSELKAIGN